MPRMIAVVANGVWSTVEVPEPPHAPEPVVKEIVREVLMSIVDYNGCVEALAGVVAAASRLSFRDQQRIRDAAHAAGSLLSAQCRIENADDRKHFERELHRALAR